MNETYFDIGLEIFEKLTESVILDKSGDGEFISHENALNIVSVGVRKLNDEYKKLKQQNEEMLNFIILIYNCHKISCTYTGREFADKSKAIIEKIKGKPIDEVLK